MSKTILIRGGRVIDPSQGVDETTNVFIADGRIAGLGKSTPSSADEVIDAFDQLVLPGLIDMHVHLREPGFEEKETIASGTAAAAAGGFSAVACMPNTDPALDTDSHVEFVVQQTARCGATRVYPIGAITKGRKGKELAEIGLMLRAGAVAFSDDGDGVADPSVCLRAMQYIGMFDKLFIQHCEDKALSGRGCMNAGLIATRLGLPGAPAIAEEVMAQRDIALARSTGIRYHVAHVSTRGTVNLVRQAKSEGLRVTTEVCPHHLVLNDECCATYDPNYKMNPPLRTQADVDACLAGVRDGTIDCLVSDHAPHSHQEKELGFQEAPFGIIGLETSLALFIKALIEPKVIDWGRLVSAMSTRPAQLLGVPGGTLRPDPRGGTAGAPADVTIVDPHREWVYDVERSRSKSRNSPFHGWKLRGRAAVTIVGGAVRHRLGRGE